MPGGRPPKPKICVQCKKPFVTRLSADQSPTGERLGTRHRTRCYECLPYTGPGGSNEGAILQTYSNPCLGGCGKIIDTKHIAAELICPGCRSRLTATRMKRCAVIYMGGACRDCGLISDLQNDLSCFDFHHLNEQEKDFAINAWNGSWDTLERELQKCILLCACCHRKRHSKKVSDQELSFIVRMGNPLLDSKLGAKGLGLKIGPLLSSPIEK